VSTWKDLAKKFRYDREAARRSIRNSLSALISRLEREQAATDLDDESDVELLGRDATYDDALWSQLQASESRVVSSSNVYSYTFEAETSTKGTLFVTFLNWQPGMKASERSGPGSTYSYADVAVSKFNEFQRAASESAGKAVWDYLRVRGTQYGHQHQYKLVQVSGDYVPRKATKKGFAERTLVAPGMSPRNRRASFRRSESRDGHPAGQFFKRNTLARTEKAGKIRRGDPDRAEPNRGN
jgi:hypothetical protein